MNDETLEKIKANLLAKEAAYKELLNSFPLDAKTMSNLHEIMAKEIHVKIIGKDLHIWTSGNSSDPTDKLGTAIYSQSLWHNIEKMQDRVSTIASVIGASEQDVQMALHLFYKNLPQP